MPGLHPDSTQFISKYYKQKLQNKYYLLPPNNNKKYYTYLKFQYNQHKYNKKYGTFTKFRIFIHVNIL